MKGYSLKANLMDEDAIARSLTRIAHEILEHNRGTDNLVLLGIVRRGDVLAHRLSQIIEDIEGVEVPVGTLDITLYRDDFSSNLTPSIHASQIPVNLDEKNVVLVDDILFTGRTIRAALEALVDYGRPARVELAVVCDRGHRELPIRADFVGKNIPSARSEKIVFRIKPVDELDSLDIYIEDEE
ncbi:MAG: bifunctional pyr operon transcriptional regulator/uracil phosphoribosyltransferase PyrR [Coriobacteriia bacterium]|nr:bifunctional pyr operon transcriptional regulator/uracil phosphoribosyltransferase PyrR [Coriobacteriia bacterium]